MHVAITLKEKLQSYDLTRENPASSICFIGKGVLQSLHLQMFLRIKNPFPPILEEVIEIIPSPSIRFDEICSLFPSSMCFLAVIHSTGPDVISAVPVRVLCSVAEVNVSVSGLLHSTALSLRM